ncbi:MULTISPECIES: CopG family antitoxin [unclassified Marinobacterium]|uniref:CopG family antitoxin n=1 Tax=unclassified Marinobacterium TaxID=2644139 RepID=UPI00156A5DA4|nr:MULTISPECIES: CopG family antitoxin [unclassified Marinobacterium]NRP46017.1 hypothetical protein [Marinobacterium sp. xm-d-543]NRQ22352.1 hypothetical protein [Marinobacterium sp. xm-m-312]
MIKYKKIPQFKTEADERAFWESHDSTEYFDWRDAKQVVMQNLQQSPETNEPYNSDKSSGQSNLEG